MDTKNFDQSIGDLASALGDPTRRGIYVTVREGAAPVTAAEISTIFDIHPNVARHHLDRLASDGYLRVTRRRPDGKSGPGAGRPAKCYEATAKEIAIQFPPRRHDLLAELLVQVIQRIAPDDGPAIAEQVGREYGRALAGEIGLPDEDGFDAAVTSVARAMMGVGFDMKAEAGTRRLLTSHCPFGQTAANHPELVCKIDQGIVSGMLETIGTHGVTVHPHDSPDAVCVTDV